MSDDITFSGMFHHGEGEEPEGWVDGAPTSSTDQYCAFCATALVGWVHPLDPAKIAYRAWGKGYTLPTFWALCDRCEQLDRDRNDEAIVALMTTVNGADDVNEDIRKPLAAFRDADQGARRLEDSTDRDEVQ